MTRTCRKAAASVVTGEQQRAGASLSGVKTRPVCHSCVLQTEGEGVDRAAFSCIYRNLFSSEVPSLALRSELCGKLFHTLSTFQITKLEKYVCFLAFKEMRFFLIGGRGPCSEDIA